MAEEKVKSEDDTNGVKEEVDGDDSREGRVWRVQAHARSSITCMKVDPVNGSGVSRPLPFSYHAQSCHSFFRRHMIVPSGTSTSRPSSPLSCTPCLTRTC